MPLIKKEKSDEQQTNQKAGRDAKSTTIHIDNLTVNQVFHTEGFRGLRYDGRKRKAEQKLWEKGQGIYTFDKPVLNEAVRINDLDKETLKMLTRYCDIFDNLSQSDRTIFVSVCKTIVDEDKFTRTEYENKEEELKAHEELTLMKNEFRTTHGDRFRWMYNKMRSQYIDNVVIPLLKKLEKKYDGEQITNAFRVQWNAHMKSNFEIFTNEYTTSESLISGINERLSSGQSCVNVYIKGEQYFERTKKQIDTNFSDDHDISMNRGIVIAKMNTAKIAITKKD